MAPGSGKRKRSDRNFSHDDGAGRPSPHRPENLNMAQRMEAGGGRSGRGGRDNRRQSRQGGQADNVNAVPVGPRASAPPPAQQSKSKVPDESNMPAAEFSQAGTPSQLPATPAQPTAQEARKVTPPPPAPYAYEHLTDEVLQSWQERGKATVMNVAKEADEMDTSAILQELVRSSLDDRLDPVEAGSVVKEMIADKQQKDSDSDVAGLLLSAISLLHEGEILGSALPKMVAATDIDPETIRMELDVVLLKSLGLVRDSFARMKTRKTTNLLYRQANYNLLREETEGYAKLLTEYFNIAEEASGNREISTEMAEDAFQRIKALVGAFDLDPGRVLDITLDISANALVKAFGFFVKFYRCSSWWPDDGLLDNVRWEQDEGPSAFPSWALPGSSGNAYAEEESDELAATKRIRDDKFWDRVREQGIDAFFQLNARRIVDFETVAELLNTEEPVVQDQRNNLVNEDKRKRINENRKYMRDTRTLPPPGNSDAAQLLGFKLSFYASPSRDAEDVMPENLIHFTALLIKVGFVSLRDIYPHLHPSDENMPKERVRLEKEKAEKEAKARPGGAPNALAMAGLLTDDTAPTARRALDKDRSGGATPKSDKKEEEEQEARLPQAPNQKLMLLKALLAHGDLPDALFILGRFPWLIDVDPTLPPYLNRVFRHMLGKVAETVKPLSGRPGSGDARDQLSDAGSGPQGALQFGTRLFKRPPQRWLQLEMLNERDGTPGRYYYTEWADTVPVCRDLDDVLLLCNTLIPLLGAKIGQDTVVLGTLVRLARKNLMEDGSDANCTRWLELMRRLLIPALSLTMHNPSLTEEVYQLLMLYPTTTRYDLYADWFAGRTSRLPDIAAAFNYNKAEVKEVLRRVSNENAKMQARALGKVSYSSPGVLITFMINQLESYSNMIPALVECTKHFPKLAYDVMIWCLIRALSGQNRERMQGDGMLTSPWLQALSQFVASLFSRYPGLNPSPILQYLASELRNGDSTNLEMFDQVLAAMAGIRSDTEYNDAQVLAMAGGEQLQTQVVQQLADKRHQSKSQAHRLIKALAEPGLIGQTLTAIAQERQMYAQHESSKFMPLKVLGNNIDKIQQVFAQYLEVLKTNLKPEEFEAVVPEVVSLIADFGLEPGMAFTICRSVIAYRMNEHDELKRQQEHEQKKQQMSIDKSGLNGDVEMTEPGVKPASEGAAASPPSELKEAVEGNEEELAVTKVDGQEAATSQPNGVFNSSESPWHPVLEPIIERLRDVSEDLETRVKIPFFVTFWTLSQSDIVVYTESYHQEIDRVQAQIKELSNSRADKSSTAIEARERKKRELTEVQSKLRAEVRGRIASYTKLSNRLSQQEKHHWLDRSRQHAELDSRHFYLLQECFLPRAMLSALDAHYSFLMLKMLHDKGAPGFSTLHLLMQLFRKQELAALMFQCTALEAQHLGRFLNETLKLVASWHGDKAVYENQALGKNKLPGFVTKMEDSNDPSSWSFMDFEVFRRLVFNWHSMLNLALQMCFESGEYMHIKNGIIVLKAVVQVFPAINFHGKNLINSVEKLSKEDDRQDLKLMALSLLAPLKNRQQKWVMPQAFRLNDPSKDGRPSSRATSARAETPQPGTGTPKLNASAAEFKPRLTNGTKTSSGAVIEDGEVEEGKQPAAKAVDTAMSDARVSDKGGHAAAAKKEAGPEDGGQLRAKSPEATATPRLTPSGPAKDQQRPASKPPTPAPTGPRGQPAADAAVRDESNRPASTQPGRSGHDLPSRPEPRPSPRLALIQGDKAGAPSNEHDSRQADKDRRRDRDTKDERAQSTYPQPADPRSNSRSLPMEPPREPSQHGRAADLTPSGPRHGRLARDVSRDMGPPPTQPESSFGRLSQPPDLSAGPPAGPRAPSAPGGRGGRNFTAPQPSAGTRNEPSGRSSTSSHPAEQQSVLRQGSGRQQPERRSSGPQPLLDRHTASISAPSAPPVQEENIHPSRRGMMGPQLQTNVPPINGNRSAASPTSGPPSGPRGTAGRAPAAPPVGPSPIGSGPPTGPGGRRNDRQWQNLNAQMQGGNGAQASRTPDVSFRGAATNRQNNIGMSSVAAPAPASSMEPPPRRSETGPRYDGPLSRPDSRAELKQDQFYQNHAPDHPDGGRPRRTEDERAERHHSSRNPSREGRGDGQPPERPPPLQPSTGDGRDKRGGRDEHRARDERGHREAGREPRGLRGDEGRRLPDMPGTFSGQPPPPPQWARNESRGNRRDGPAEDGRQGGRGPPRGDELRGSRREDERRESGRGPPRDEGQALDSRKRRHEEATLEGSKRRRSGR
ncbi:hypothetical protein B0A50_02103 [Salinomyces thailandicus]|uniref:THO complex subunit 2 n=1 Tax=Salinomyces thailandicus TaxID=706561 RepID=A0A4U0U7U7_9PEZI|nr:hypothetical protein B0A50_02103 [Salinomyces thailandica]